MHIKSLVCAFVLFFLSVGSESARAYDNKLDVAIGYFSVNGTNNDTNKKAAVSGVGAYQIRYRRALTSHFDFAAGYSLYFKQVITGSSIYGLNLEVIYFPLSASGTIESKTDNITLSVAERLRPFVSGSFLQRNFSGLQTTFVGFGAGAGAEYTLTQNMSFISYARYAMLNATSLSTATELTLTAGLVFGF